LVGLNFREALIDELVGKVVLVTGGTGSFGKEFVEVMLREYRPKKLVIFSRG